MDVRGRPLTDPDQLERIRRLAIPPAWTEVWISSDPAAKLQATGIDRAGRRQYRYHPEFRRRQEQAKFDRLVRFAEMLPDLRAVMTGDMDRELLARERVAAVALRLIDHGFFRVGSDRYLERNGTYGITTLQKRHVHVRPPEIRLEFIGKHRTWIRRAIVDDELAAAIGDLKAVRGGPRLFRYRSEGTLRNLTSERLNGYVHRHAGDEFSAKDFRTWGGTLTAAIGFAERGPAATHTAQQRAIAAVMRQVAERLGNTPRVARASYVSPAVIEEYVAGRTIRDYRPRALRVIGARDAWLDPEEVALMVLCRGWQERRRREAEAETRAA